MHGDQSYQQLFNLISATYQGAIERTAQTINRKLLETYWEIGQYIVEFEQGGAFKAAYGKSLLENLAKDLSFAHGKGFSRSNLNYMRLLYSRYPICEELPHKLSWTHFCELVKIDDPLERSFYEKQAILESWSTTELKRQKKIIPFPAPRCLQGQTRHPCTGETGSNGPKTRRPLKGTLRARISQNPRKWKKST